MQMKAPDSEKPTNEPLLYAVRATNGYALRMEIKWRGIGYGAHQVFGETYALAKKRLYSRIHGDTWVNVHVLDHVENLLLAYPLATEIKVEPLEKAWRFTAGNTVMLRPRIECVRELV